MTARLHYHTVKGRKILCYHRPDGKIKVHGMNHAIRRKPARITKEQGKRKYT